MSIIDTILDNCFIMENNNFVKEKSNENYKLVEIMDNICKLILIYKKQKYFKVELNK